MEVLVSKVRSVEPIAIECNISMKLLAHNCRTLSSVSSAHYLLWVRSVALKVLSRQTAGRGATLLKAHKWVFNQISNATDNA